LKLDIEEMKKQPASVDGGYCIWSGKIGENGAIKGYQEGEKREKRFHNLGKGERQIKKEASRRSYREKGESAVV